MELTTPDFSDAYADAFYPVGDGLHVTVLVVPDEDTTIDDYDCYGRISWIDYRSDRHGRPDGFDGAAEIIRGRDSYWWQPPSDVKRTDPHFSELRTLVRNLVDYGFSSVGLILEESLEDSLGAAHTVRIASAWLGGIDSLDDGYLATVCAELWHEIVAQVEEEQS